MDVEVSFSRVYEIRVTSLPRGAANVTVHTTV